MANLRLTLACGPYDRTQALRDGTITPEGIELNYITLQPAEIFWYCQFNALRAREGKMGSDQSCCGGRR